MAGQPSTMRSLVAPRPCKPAEFEVRDMPLPTLKGPDDVLVKVHAGGFRTGDVQFAGPQGRWLFGKEVYPLKLGIEAAGVVADTGPGVNDLKVGDRVYGLNFQRPFLAQVPDGGGCSEYWVIPEKLLLRMPPHLSFEDASALPGAVVTAYQAIRRGVELLGQGERGLEGKTAFVTGALSVTGSIGCQLLKNVFGVGRLIATVSTAKMGLVEQYMPGVVDQLVDYTKEDVVGAAGKASVDFAYNTQWNLVGTFPLVRPGGVAMSIASVPTSDTMRLVLGADRVPFWMAWLLDGAQWWYKWKLWGTGVKAEFLSGNPGSREDLEKAGEYVARGLVKPVTTVVKLEDLEAVRRACEKVASGKGTIGGLVIHIV